VPITFGGDFSSTAAITLDSLTQTATLGSTGANSILFVVIEAEGDYSAVSVDYNGAAMTSLGGKITYSGTATIYREFWYLNGNLSSGQDIHVFSGSPTTLGQAGSRAWHVYYFTYGGVGGLGTTSVNATNFLTSNSGSAVSVAFNFTPSSTTSSIVQMLSLNAQNAACALNYSPANGTPRQSLASVTLGAVGAEIAFSDYAPGSTSQFSLSQDFTPNFCNYTGYGWGIELLKP
jgi:hypothetical protein